MSSHGGAAFVEKINPEEKTVKELRKLIKPPEVDMGSFILQDNGFLSLQGVDKGVENLWKSVNLFVPSDWQGYPDNSEFDKNPKRGVWHRNTGYSSGIDVNRISDTVCEHTDATVFISNALMICNILKDPTIEEDEKKRVAAYAKYFFIPIVKTFEIPALSLELENETFRILDKANYDKARGIWAKEHGCEYEEEYLERFRESIENIIDKNTDLTKDDVEIHMRKKSLYEYFSKYHWQHIVDDGYAVTLTIKETENSRELLRKQNKSTFLLGDFISDEIINKGFLANGEMGLRRNEEIENWIDKPKKSDPTYKVLQTIIESKADDLPFNRFEIRVTLAEFAERNIIGHPLYKIWVQSPYRQGTSEKEVLALGQLTRMLSKKALGSSDPGLEQEIKDLRERIFGRRGLPVCIDFGHSTIHSKHDIRLAPWEYLNELFKKEEKYTADFIAGFELVRTNVDDGLYLLETYRLLPVSGNGIQVILIDSSGSQTIVENFELKPYDSVAVLINAGDGVENLLTTEDLLKTLSFDGIEKTRELLETSRLSQRLPLAIHGDRSKGANIRERMILFWNQMLVEHFATVSEIPPDKRESELESFNQIRKRLGRIIDIIDILRYSTSNRDEDLHLEYGRLRKALTNVTDGLEKEYLWKTIESNEKYKNLVEKTIDFNEYFVFEKKDGKAVLVSELDTGRSWFLMAERFKNNGFYLFDLMKQQVHEHLLKDGRKLWEKAVEIAPRRDGEIIANNVFDINTGKKSKLRILDTDTVVRKKESKTSWVEFRDVILAYKEYIALHGDPSTATDLKRVFENRVSQWLTNEVSKLKDEKRIVVISRSIKKAPKKNNLIKEIAIVAANEYDKRNLLEIMVHIPSLFKRFVNSISLLDGFITEIEHMGVRNQTYSTYLGILKVLLELDPQDEELLTMRDRFVATLQIELDETRTGVIRYMQESSEYTEILKFFLFI